MPRFGSTLGDVPTEVTVLKEVKRPTEGPSPSTVPYQIPVIEAHRSSTPVPLSLPFPNSFTPSTVSFLPPSSFCSILETTTNKTFYFL